MWKTFEVFRRRVRERPTLAVALAGHAVALLVLLVSAAPTMLVIPLVLLYLVGASLATLAFGGFEGAFRPRPRRSPGWVSAALASGSLAGSRRGRH